ncbi:MAG: hypothetical protein P4L85_09290 [Paludisphaera borealis]|uniref:hypothetical protein n=1 Tax=Paludisphaera borealis TaxID=1387353 RepID=UPI00284A54F4|nr:hypothetical protein [Paludisphaera borealis]MDR3619531.1 hypothetical protein [Paludisphaera borealis]
MPTTLRQLCRPLIALAAILATSLASEASACSMMTSSPMACTVVCGCCSPGTSEASTSRSEAARIATLPQTPMTCQSTPGAACSCRSQVPATPTPKPAQSTAEGRSELSPASVLACLGDEAAARNLLAPRGTPAQSPPKTPLYLRNARLLF